MPKNFWISIKKIFLGILVEKEIDSKSAYRRRPLSFQSSPSSSSSFIIVVIVVDVVDVVVIVVVVVVVVVVLERAVVKF